MVRGGRVSCLAFLREPQQLASVVHGRGELIALQYHSRKNLIGQRGFPGRGDADGRGGGSGYVSCLAPTWHIRIS